MSRIFSRSCGCSNSNHNHRTKTTQPQETSTSTTELRPVLLLCGQQVSRHRPCPSISMTTRTMPMHNDHNSRRHSNHRSTSMMTTTTTIDDNNNIIRRILICRPCLRFVPMMIRVRSVHRHFSHGVLGVAPVAGEVGVAVVAVAVLVEAVVVLRELCLVAAASASPSARAAAVDLDSVAVVSVDAGVAVIATGVIALTTVVSVAVLLLAPTMETIRYHPSRRSGSMICLPCHRTILEARMHLLLHRSMPVSKKKDGLRSMIMMTETVT
mmetsp:Transcript_52061/g.125674  ORF Transcript_52061/g.125674 Transcript_52061/m.125674 type:complete len:268 (+) Transcript_52061:658-1461(+)